MLVGIILGTFFLVLFAILIVSSILDTTQIKEYQLKLAPSIDSGINLVEQGRFCLVCVRNVSSTGIPYANTSLSV